MKKESGPLYYRIKEDIIDRIKQNEFTKGQMLPTEKELCEEYGACRVTIRKALELLIQEGVLERGFGKTASVRSDRVPRSLNSLNGLHEELEKSGIKCSSYVLSAQVIEIPGKIAQEMGLGAGVEVMRLERLRYADGVPLCYQLLYLNIAECRGLDVKKLAASSLYGILEGEYGLVISRAEQTIRAEISDYRVAALLELPEKTCMLCVDRTAWLEDGVCIEYSQTQYVAGRYTLNMTLRRGGED